MNDKYANCKLGFEYANDVISKKIIACEFVIQACKRFKNDLERKDLFFDFEDAERVLKIIQLFPHVKGALAGQRLILSPWQIFIIINLFGLKYKKTKLRKYSLAYIEVPRKNGKTTILSAIANYLMAFDGEAGAEIYSCASSRDQARISWDISSLMWNLSGKIKKMAGIKTMANSIVQLKTGSSFKPVSSDSKTLDGLNTHGAIIDELHSHKNSGVYDVILTSTGSRLSPVIMVISSAGFDSTGICYQVRDEVKNILNGNFEDDSFFGIIYTLDKNDKFTDPDSWYKANPNLGISVTEKYLRDMVNKAIRSPANLSNILTKNFNLWQTVGTAFLSPMEVDKCIKKIKWSKFKEKRSFLGLDLSTKVDLTGLVQVYPVEKSKKTTYYVRAFAYLPDHVIQSGENDSFKEWVVKGHLKECQGKTIDHDMIKDDIKNLIENGDVEELAFDPWNSTFFIKELQKESGIFNEDFFVEYGQTVKNFSSVMKTLEALILEGRIVFDDNPVLRWCMLNCEAKIDVKGNLYPRKSIAKNRIDLMIALLMALGRILYHEEEEASTYEERDILIF